MFSVWVRHWKFSSRLLVYVGETIKYINIKATLCFQAYRNVYWLKFSDGISSRQIMYTWLLEHSVRCFKGSVAWLVQQTDWKHWPVWLERDILFSTKFRCIIDSQLIVASSCDFFLHCYVRLYMLHAWGFKIDY